MNPYYEKLYELIASNCPFVQVLLVDASGSVPQHPGAKMLVTADGLYYGTVGGGKVENRAIQEAQAMVASSGENTRFVQWNLNHDIGMTCGGNVKLYFEAFNTSTWHIVIFGAGHISQALVPMLLGLDCSITCIDPRCDWLDRLPDHSRLTRVHTDDMPGQVQHLPEGAFIALITMGHTTDKPILLEILRTRQFPYLGVIGSRAKAAQLKKDVAEAGLPPSCQEAFHCPIGLNVGGNHPQEIAISIAAQMLQVRDQLRAAPSHQRDTAASHS